MEEDNTDLTSTLRLSINNFEGPKTLAMLAESIGLILIDAAFQVLNLQGEVDIKLVQYIEKKHSELPTLATAMFLQGVTMLGWLPTEEIINSERITIQTQGE